jgi:hypothetical protein
MPSGNANTQKVGEARDAQDWLGEASGGLADLEDCWFGR